MFFKVLALALAASAAGAPTTKCQSETQSKISFTVPNAVEGQPDQTLFATVIRDGNSNGGYVLQGTPLYSPAFFNTSSGTTAFNSKSLIFDLTLYNNADGVPRAKYGAVGPTLRLGDGPAQAINITAASGYEQFQWDNKDANVSHRLDDADEMFLACLAVDGNYYLAFGAPKSDGIIGGGDDDLVPGCHRTVVKQKGVSC